LSEYTCYKCKETYEKINNEEWNDYKAAEELLTLYPECKNDKTEILCDECNKDFLIWFARLTDEEKKKLRE